MTPTDLHLGSYATTVARLDASSGDVALAVGLPTDPAWMALPEALGAVPGWHADLTDRVGDARAAAASLSAWVAHVPALLVGVPVLFGAAVPDLEPDDLHVLPHRDGWFEALAADPISVEPPTLDPLVVAADTIHRLTAPLVTALVQQLPVGRRLVWGSVADLMGWYALHLAYATGDDPDAAWTRAMRLLDVLARHLDVPLVRPEPLTVPWSGGVRRHQTRGTCCLYHRTCDEPIDGDGSCATCPLRSPESRVERLAAWLETTAVPAEGRAS